MRSRTSRFSLVAGGVALSAMTWLAVGCSSNEGNAPETSTTTTTTTTTTTPPATTPATPPPASPTENVPRTAGGNPFTSIPPNANDNGRNPGAPRAPQ
ncbi:hypothetical protein ACXYX3_16290 [Mycobacterium sp. C3-094]